jgi:DnaJ-class molecular chaperone
MTLNEYIAILQERKRQCRAELAEATEALGACYNPRRGIVCPDCDGTGEYWDGYDKWHTCKSCNGTKVLVWSCTESEAI